MKKSPVILLQISNFASALGNSIVVITIPWLILERTDSPAFAGVVAAVSAFPAILVSPIGGWMVDHLGRRAVSGLSNHCCDLWIEQHIDFVDCSCRSDF
jgi:MFS family permease